MDLRKKEFNSYIEKELLNYSDITVDELKKYLKELGGEVKYSDKKADIIQKIFKATTINKFYKDFSSTALGIPTYKLKDKFNISKYQLDKMIQKGFIKVLYKKEVKVHFGYIDVKYMDAHKFFFLTNDDIEKWLNTNTRKRKSSSDRLEELKLKYKDSLLLVAKCMYRINKLAKTYRDLKYEAYNNDDYRLCKGAKTRSINLYSLKNDVINKLLKDYKEEVNIMGYHNLKDNESLKFVYFDIKNIGFHQPLDGDIKLPKGAAKTLKNLGELDGFISKENKSDIPADLAVLFLTDWLNKKRPI